MSKILFLIIGVLLGLCSFFFVRMCELNSGIEEMSALLRENIKETEKELVSIKRRCVKMNSQIDNLSTDIQILKDNALGEEIKIGDKWYFKGGMYGQVGAINTNVDAANEKLNDISTKLNAVKRNIGENYGITGIHEKLDDIITLVKGLPRSHALY